MMPATSAPAATAGPGQHALTYTALGWRVLPIKPGEKRPPMTAWQKEASTDGELIKNWFRNLYKGHGVGIATGEESGIWVLDIDTGPDKPGDASLAELEQAHGQLPPTVEAVTGSGGRHLYFLWPEGQRVVTRRDTKNVTSPLPAGIDVRGEGGQVLAPPTIHPSGTIYTWRDGCAPWERDVAEAPQWLLKIVCEREAPEAPSSPPQSAGTFLGDDGVQSESIAGWFDQTEHWDTLLLRDGWTPMPAIGDQQYWVRPGKEKRDGHSAVLHLPDGPFVIFSTDGTLTKYAEPSARVASGDGWAYSKFGYYAVSRHSGDRSEAARRLRDVRTERERFTPVVEGDPAQVDNDSILIDWETFWAKDHSAEEWIAYPVVPAHRQVALYAPGGTGKSLLALAIAAALATGRPCLGQPPVPRQHVLYFDYEMTEADLMERLTDLGYDHGDDWSHLHYALLPALDPLDTKDGARRVCALADQVGAELVVIDTMARAVEGDENDADTYRKFYQWTGRALKATNRALLRLDHAGKEADKGQRGSSAKNDDVDVVWQMALAEDGYVLTVRKARMGWIPRAVNIAKVEGPPLEFTTGTAFMWPAGTKALAELIDSLGLADDASTRDAQDALKAAGQSRRRALVVAAVRYRTARSDPFTSAQATSQSLSTKREPLPGTTLSTAPGNHFGNHPTNNGSDQPGTTQEPPGTTLGVPVGRGGGDCKGTTPAPAPVPDTNQDDIEPPF